jgi:hypothetical protein
LSEPIDSGTRPAVTWAPDPPLEPPGEKSVFQGFLILPKSGLSPVSPSANLFMLALPISTVPDSLIRRATAASFMGTRVIRDFARCGTNSSRVDVILKADGNSMQRPAVVLMGDLGIQMFSLLKGSLWEHRYV